MSQSSRLNWRHIDDCSDIKNRMIPNMRLVAFLVMALLATALKAQDLEPRLYVNLPVNQNFVGLVAAYSEGAVLNSANVPVEDASLYYNRMIAAYVRTFPLMAIAPKLILISPTVVSKVVRFLKACLPVETNAPKAIYVLGLVITFGVLRPLVYKSMLRWLEARRLPGSASS